MNTTINHTISYSSDWLGNANLCRSASSETIYSVQDKETDVVQDTTDTDTSDTDTFSEYEPVTEEDEGASIPGLQDSTDESDHEIIRTKVIEVVAESDMADDEAIASDERDEELGHHDYWHCAQCGASNNNPLYRFCEKCYKVRKNFFPPMPKRKPKRKEMKVQQPLSQDSGVEFAATGTESLSQASVYETDAAGCSQPTLNTAQRYKNTKYKRRASSLDRTDSDIDSDYGPTRKKAKSAERDVIPLSKTMSDPVITIGSLDRSKKESDTCIICDTEPKSGVFVHGRIAHICCCYKCAMKVWAKAKRCPVCNCRVSNVLRAVVM